MWKQEWNLIIAVWDTRKLYTSYYHIVLKAMASWLGPKYLFGNAKITQGDNIAQPCL